MEFTDKGIRALKPRAKRYDVWQDGRTGFGLRVAPSGRKSWLFMYRFGGRARRMTLGPYPAVSLATARVRFAEAKRKLDHGEDPGASAKAEKLADRGASTVRQLVDEYLARSAKDLRSHDEIKRILERDVVPAWGSRKAKAINRRDVILLLDGIVDRGSPVMANRTLNWTRRMFNFAASRDVVERNPCVGVEAPGREIERERVLSDAEIVGLWKGLSKASVTDSVRLAAKLVLVTGQRPGEVAEAAKSEFDLDDQRIWTIPAERTKNGRGHVVPLAPFAVELIRNAFEANPNSKWLCPGRVEDQPLTSRALGKAFLRNPAELGIPAPHSPAKAPSPGSPEAIALRRERRRVAFTPHDLRRTAATRMTELGFTRFIIDRILNHTEPGVGRVYDRYQYLREKRAALEAWAVRLEEIIAGREVRHGNVVHLRPA